MAEADLDRRKPSKAGTASAVAHFWKSNETVAQCEPQPKREALQKLTSNSHFGKGVIPMEKRKARIPVAQ